MRTVETAADWRGFIHLAVPFRRACSIKIEFVFRAFRAESANDIIVFLGPFPLRPVRAAAHNVLFRTGNDIGKPVCGIFAVDWVLVGRSSTSVGQVIVTMSASCQ